MRVHSAWAVILLSAVVAAGVVGCGGASADRPLTIPVGLTRDALIGELRSIEYCEGDALASERVAREVFEKCDVPGVEHGQSWVVAHYQDGRVARLQRFERFADPARAQDRFNLLIEKRTAANGPPDDGARATLAARELPSGTRTWVAFRAGATTVAAVYLLDPQPPENASILEEIVSVE